ncbi:MAG: hypothetical protein IIZ56_00305 [Clostridia bacterium]|nr:hypothetical protein [Clostridia bacterium]MBR6108676.1 hypothetical protein [Clostridia bacterium]
MSAFALKIIACITMLIDHAAYVFQPQLDSVAPWIYIVCRMIGRLAFPLFAMGVAEGAVHTSNAKKYISRMFLFALIAQIPFSLMTGVHSPSVTLDLFGLKIGFKYELSVMVTLLLGLIVSSGIQNGKHLRAALALLLAFLLDRTVGMDYGLLGVLFIVGLYLTRSRKGARLFVLLLFSVCLYLSPLKEFAKELVGGSPAVISRGVLNFLATLASGLLMLAYNRQKGHSSGLFFYIFYPVHMLIIVGAFYAMLIV